MGQDDAVASQENEVQSEAWIADLFLSLREGDKVYLNDRDRPFTVTYREWDDRESGYWRYSISAYGTSYHGIVTPEKEHTQKSVSGFRTDAGTTIRPVRAHRDPERETRLVSDTRADEWLADAGITIE